MGDAIRDYQSGERSITQKDKAGERWDWEEVQREHTATGRIYNGRENPRLVGRLLSKIYCLGFGDHAAQRMSSLAATRGVHFTVGMIFWKKYNSVVRRQLTWGNYPGVLNND